MWRLLVFMMFIAGTAIGFTRISFKPVEKTTPYRITSLNASHFNKSRIVNYNEDYYMQLSFVQSLDTLKYKRNKKKNTKPSYVALNPITELNIVSTAKLDELHQANSDITSLFNFHYVRKLKSTQGSLIKEGMTIPLNDFTYTVNQNESAGQLKELKLKLKQKPVMQSQLQFIVTAKLENGEILRDTTSEITFEGVRY
jgi:hypothetical protein